MLVWGAWPGVSRARPDASCHASVTAKSRPQPFVLYSPQLSSVVHFLASRSLDMPKRRSTQNVDDDDYEMMSDEDFVDHPRKNTKEPPARPRKVAKLSQSKLIISGGLTIQKDYDKNANIIRSHTVASHIISSKAADQMSGALVTWFDGVYSARGMPWRKPFDSAWNAEERGQRAYEARLPPFYEECPVPD